MEYYEQLTFTGKGDVEEAEETAIKLIREFEELALQRCPDKGYIVGYSGGKDSDCLVDLFFRAFRNTPRTYGGFVRKSRRIERKIYRGGTLRDISAVEMYEFYFRVR